MHNYIRTSFFRVSIAAIITLLLVSSFNLMLPGTASAGMSDSLEISGDGVTPTTFTRTQLEAMPQYQHLYSVINTWPAKKWFVGEGVTLRDLLTAAKIKDEAKLIRFTSNDGYSVTLTVQELLNDQRYYFPRLMDNSDSNGSLNGSQDGRELVEPIIALKSVEGSNNPKYINNLNTLLLMIGQRAVSEQTGNIFIKYVNKIEVLTTAPTRWDAPEANPGSGEVVPGTMVALSNQHMDDDKIYYTTDGTTPTLNSPIYNWIAKRWWSARADVLGIYNHPIGPINGNTTIKAISIGPGKMDSEVATFTYKTASAAQVPELAQPKQPGASLADIKGHWAQKYIEQLVNSAAVNGYPNGRFMPDNNISRAEFVVIMVKSFGMELKGNSSFADVKGHWAERYIATAVADGVVSGYDAAHFGPDERITREQMATMICRAAKLSASTGKSDFKDNDSISSWAREAVVSANQNGTIRGYPDNTIKPQGYASRAEAVTMIAGALNKK